MINIWLSVSVNSYILIFIYLYDYTNNLYDITEIDLQQILFPL